MLYDVICQHEVVMCLGKYLAFKNECINFFLYICISMLVTKLNIPIFSNVKINFKQETGNGHVTPVTF